jgi:hypothetical protein
MAGTWTVTAANKGVVLDQDCILNTIAFKIPPNAFEIAAYDPVTGLPTAGRFTLVDGTPPNGTVFYNFDPYTNWAWVMGKAIVITPVPPQPTRKIGSLWCSSIPDGAEFEIVTL